ncbi:uncharacterized protein LOC131329751 [Rhododendron vialii]|uniref:uncharacterized protein LOC131329751 n=1 Tax=Rhododendron vialii TaxID=182163 RepID=UPI00265E8655|nr:uncharacterized protein LOC131329751 [Rhododendron vialii]
MRVNECHPAYLTLHYVLLFPREYSTILRARKLFQEFIVDAWASTEQNRLNFHRLNQGKIQSELYEDLADIGPDGLGPGQKVVHRPDLVARVFELKRKCLMSEIKKKQVFGKIVGYVYTIEYQKRELPHMHLLLFLQGPDKIHTCAQVGKVVCAELSDPIEDPSLFDTIKGSTG